MKWGAYDVVDGMAEFSGELSELVGGDRPAAGLIATPEESGLADSAGDG